MKKKKKTNVGLSIVNKETKTCSITVVEHDICKIRLKRARDLNWLDDRSHLSAHGHEASSQLTGPGSQRAVAPGIIIIITIIDILYRKIRFTMQIFTYMSI